MEVSSECAQATRPDKVPAAIGLNDKSQSRLSALLHGPTPKGEDTMLEIHIPSFKNLQIDHLVLDFNGTLARDGRLLDGVKERVLALANALTLHVLTADTFGNVARELSDLPCTVTVIPREDEAGAKLACINELGCASVVSIGNGQNDALMLENAALGICVIQEEGCSKAALLAADVVTTSVLDALDLIIHPLRLVATLRS